MNAFQPEGATVKIAVSASASAGNKIAENPDAVRIANTGTAVVWVRFGADSSIAATNADYPVPAGMVEVIRPSPNVTPLFVSVIATGSTGDIYFTPGSGL